jgi:hypothetical protein
VARAVPVRARTVSVLRAWKRQRLDAQSHLSGGVAVRDHLADLEEAGDVEQRPLGGDDGLGAVWQPSRFKRIYATGDEAAVPYLRPYDVFEYLPEPASHLSVARTEDLASYRLATGTILQTCSGRNLGPLQLVDEFLSTFVLSHDMIRIQISDEDQLHYVAAFLKSRAGQAVLRQRISGSVVDHLTTADAADLRIPFLAQVEVQRIAGLHRVAHELQAQARTTLAATLREARAAFPMAEREAAMKAGWTTSPRALLSQGRMDVHFHDPAVGAATKQLQDDGAVQLGEVAEAFLPGRYKRFYVEEKHGRPILSGRQLLQAAPVNLRHIADRSFKSVESMELQEGTVAFGAVGRWEGRLGQPVVVTADRVGWLASNDVMRLRVKEGSGVTAGWLWLALNCEPVQAQVAALPYGSVIDHTGPDDVETKVWLPPITSELGARAEQAWQAFGEARKLEVQAVESLEEALFGTEASLWLAS